MSIFEGPDCDDLLCVGGSAGIAFPWTSAEISWASVPNAIYYILVYGWQGEVGDFSLMVTEGEIPSNGDCSSAIFVEPGDEIEGSTEFSQIPDLEPCVSR